MATQYPAEPKVNTTDRESLIRWLVWNDPNGCYTDEDRAMEADGPATLAELQTHYREQSGNDVTPLHRDEVILAVMQDVTERLMLDDCAVETYHAVDGGLANIWRDVHGRAYSITIRSED